MILTNVYQLPDVLYDAIKKGYYDLPEDFDGVSVTSLISPPYQLKLKKEFGGGTADASDGLWSLLGSAVHSIIEKANVQGVIQELRLNCEIDGKIVTGKCDLYDTRTKEIADFKVTSKYAVKYGKPKPEWTTQLNILAYLFRQHGFEVKSLKIHAILRDFLKFDSYKHEFPETPFITIQVPLWSNEEALLFIKEKLRVYTETMGTSLMFLPPCTPEERWNVTTYKFYKTVDSERALPKATFYTQQEANQFAEANPTADLRVTSVDKRCKEYCSVKEHCSIGRNL